MGKVSEQTQDAVAEVRRLVYGLRPPALDSAGLGSALREWVDRLDNGAIAERLHLSPKTVANYLTSVFAKLAVTDRSQAIVKARDAGLGRG
jgi:signal transduction histidine kinase